MKLLLITQKVDANDFYFSFFISWIELLAKKFDQLEIICLGKGDFNLPENVQVFSLGKETKNSKIAQLFNFYKYIFNLDYDKILVHMNPIWVVLGGLVWRWKSKNIFLWYTHKSVTFKLWLAEIFVHKIFTASPESFRLRSKKVVVTGHGIDTELFKPAGTYGESKGVFKILAGGRITPSKNYETLIEAAKILKDQNFSFKVDIFGEPILNSDHVYEKKLRETIKKLDMESDFRFLGKILNNDMPKFYQTHDLFVHLSRTGSLDKVILEAMACGIKVISSNDASKAFLPKEFIFSNDNSVELGNKIILSAQKERFNMSDYVIKNHNLETLISKISEIIKK